MKSGLLTVHVAALWLTISFVAAIAGPFGTGAAPFWQRGAYWLAAVLLAIVLTFALIYGARDMTRPRWAPRPVKAAVGALVFSLVYTAALAPFTVWMFGPAPEVPAFWQLLTYVAPIAVSVTLLLEMFRRDADEAPPESPLFRRLKPELGRDLIRLSMQDHYVEARTAAGSQLVLMRFADALVEVESIEGWRLHRSHWVAQAHAGPVRSVKGRYIMRTADGEDLPVSRTYLPALRAAGLTRR